MIFTKYAGDYKLDGDDPKGRRTVYCGKHYILSENPEDRRTRICFLIGFSVVATIAFVLSLSFPNSLARLSFVIMPFAFNALMLYSTWVAILRYSFNKKELLERKEKETMIDKMKSSSIVGFIICLFSFGAAIAATGLKLFSFGSYEIGFLAGLVVVLICFGGVFVLAKAIEVKEQQ